MRFLIFLFIIFLNSCSEGKDTLKIKGSDTEVNLAVQLAELFRDKNSELLVSVSGGGSGLGIASLLNGTADIANSSRSINDEEADLFKKRDIELKHYVFAQDAIAFVVSDQLPLDSISTIDLSKILNGEFSNWSALIKINRPINIYGRQNNSGTHDFVKHILKIKFSPQAKQMNGNAQILEAIKADNSGIGYVGAGYVMTGTTHGIKILKIFHDSCSAISPLDAKKIASGDYYFQRPLFQYYKKSDSLKVNLFLDFERSETGSKIILASGYYPISK